MSLVSLLVLVLMICLAVYVFNRIPDPTIRSIVAVVVFVVILLWLLDAFGYVGGGGLYLGHRR